MTWITTLTPTLRYPVTMTAQLRALQADEPIGVVALSGPVREERLYAAGLAGLKTWGHPLLVAPNVTARDGYFAGDDEQRLQGLEWLLDRGARVLVCARGGYGVTRLLHRLPWHRLVRDEICLIGFSDITALLNPLVARGGVIQVHGPMVAVGLGRARYRDRLRRLVSGKLRGKHLFRFGRQSVARHGSVSGVAIGGNLTMLCSLIGTGFEPDYDGAALFLEEVNEPLYRLDRLLTQLARSGRLSGVKAIIGGSLKGCRPVDERNQRWQQLLVEASPNGAPVVVGLPFGHGVRNLAFPVGAQVRVDTEAGEITWSS
jgi:muramoyltetrapeptide carboxypeptidase